METTRPPRFLEWCGLAVIVASLAIALVAAISLEPGPTRQSGSAAVASPGQLRSFYLEARIDTLLSDSQKAQLTEGSRNSVLTAGYLRWWYQAPYDTRWEIRRGSRDGEVVRIVVLHARTYSLYEAQTNTYWRDTLPSDPPAGPFQLPTSFAIGPMPDPSTLPEAYRLGASPETKMVGNAVLLGLPVEIWQGPSSMTTTFSSSSRTPVEIQSGVMRLWINRQYSFVLLQEADPGEGEPGYRREVTALRINQPQRQGTFDFVPPVGAREVVPPSSNNPQNAGAPPRPTANSTPAMAPLASTFPSGYLTPSYTPLNFQLAVVGVIDARGPSPPVVGLYIGPKGTIQVREQRITNPQLLQPTGSTQTSVNGFKAFLISEPARVTLTWAQGDIVVTIFTDPSVADELPRIAASMKIQP